MAQGGDLQIGRSGWIASANGPWRLCTGRLRRSPEEDADQAREAQLPASIA